MNDPIHSQQPKPSETAPTSAKGPWTAGLEFANLFMGFWTRVIVLAVGISLFISLCLEIKPKPDDINIENIAIPEEIESHYGYTSKVFATKLAEKISEIDRVGRSGTQRIKIPTGTQEIKIPIETNAPNVKVPDLDITFQEFALLVKFLMKWDVPAIHGVMTMYGDQQVMIQLWVPDRNKNMHSVAAPGVLSKLDGVVAELGERVMDIISPYKLGLYYAAMADANCREFQACNREKAIAQFKKVIAKAPHDDDKYGYLGWGNVLRDMKAQKAAIIEQYEKATILDPKFGVAYYNMGVVLLEQRQPEDAEKAIERFTQAIKNGTADSDAYNNLGIAYKDKNKFEEAISRFRKAASIDPYHAAPHFNWGLTLLQDLNKPECAITEFRKAIDIKPYTSDYYTGRAEAYMALNNPVYAGKAIEDFKRATLIDPQSVWAYIHWGRALLKLERPDTAILQFRQAIDVDKTSEPAAFDDWLKAFHELHTDNEVH